jgi:hypothetical protein
MTDPQEGLVEIAAICQRRWKGEPEGRWRDFYERLYAPLAEALGLAPLPEAEANKRAYSGHHAKQPSPEKLRMAMSSTYSLGSSLRSDKWPMMPTPLAYRVSHAWNIAEELELLYERLTGNCPKGLGHYELFDQAKVAQEFLAESQREIEQLTGEDEAVSS